MYTSAQCARNSDVNGTSWSQTKLLGSRISDLTRQGNGAMRRYILTERDRERLTDWVLHDLEDDVTRNIFTVWRYSYPRLRDDIRLLIMVTKKLRARGRWDTRPRLKPGERHLPRWMREGRKLIKKMSHRKSINKV